MTGPSAPPGCWFSPTGRFPACWGPSSSAGAFSAKERVKFLTISKTETLKNQEGIRIVYAADCPPEVSSYRVQANPDQPDTLMAEGTVDGPAFFHVYKTDRNYFPSLHLYGADGTELDRGIYLAADQSVPSPGIGSAETNLVYWVCGIWLAIGCVIARYLWDGGRPVTKPVSGD